MFLSVIIPNYNGSVFIERFFDALSNQLIDVKEYEIIIVDNGSTDNSIELFERYRRIFPNLIVCEYSETQSSYAARNHAVSQSNGDILVFTDIDCRPVAVWLQEIRNFAKTLSGDFLLSGLVELFPGGEQYNLSEWYDKMFALDQEQYSKSQTGVTANLVVTRNAYDCVNGFLPFLSGGDRDFCERVMSAGLATFYYKPEIKVLHPARSTPFEIMTKLTRVSKGLVYYEHSNSQGKRYIRLLRMVIAALLQPQHCRKVMLTIRKKGLMNLWVWRFALFAWALGLYQRGYMIYLYVGYLGRKGDGREL